jgi:AcrR family transcriptional regulator
VALAMSEVKGPRLTRREQAAATRLRMTRAAHAVFCERGYGGTTMAMIAERAGVAVQTLYFTFHTKAELLQACYALAVLGDTDPTAPQDQDWFLEVMSAPRAADAVAAFSRGNAEIHARVAVLDDTVRAAAHEPEAYAVREKSERLRRDGFTSVVTSWRDRFGLRDDRDVENSTDLLLTLASTAMYRQLVVEHGWAHDDYVAWSTTLVLEQLLAPQRGRKR